MESETHDEDGFVFVTQPLPSVAQFASWLDEQRLPDTQTLMSGRRLKEDEVSLSINRSSFIKDLVRSFLPSTDKRRHTPPPHAPAQATSPTDPGYAPSAGCSASLSEGVSEEVQKKDMSESLTSLETEVTWGKLYRQFACDIGRQTFLIEGVPAPVDPPTLTIDAIRAYLQKMMVDYPGTAALVEGFGRTPQSKGWLATLFAPLAYLNGGSTFTGAHGRGASSGEVSPHRESPSPQSPPPRASPSAGLGGLERLVRFIVLLSQQSVLAVPFEIIATQYMRAGASSTDTPLYVGEVKKSQGSPHGNPSGSPSGSPLSRSQTMCVELMKNAQNAPQLKITKPFRVFTLVDEGDVTLFEVTSVLEIDLLASYDVPLEMRWSISAAREDAVEVCLKGRKCQCLGAGSGFHRKDCPLAQGSNTASKP